MRSTRRRARFRFRWVRRPTFETPVCAQRAVEFTELDMAQVRTLKDRYGSTVNEVVLAVCSGALRTHLEATGGESDSPLIAVVPVSVRADEHEASGNHLSAMFVPLSNDLQTPLERLRTVSEASSSAKTQERQVGFGPMASLMAEAMPPAIARPVIQLGVRAGILRKVRAGNLMVSNVPGPSFPLYFTGMELCGVYPLGPVVDGIALNITVQSYRDSLFVGINACATAVPDLPRPRRRHGGRAGGIAPHGDADAAPGHGGVGPSPPRGWGVAADPRPGRVARGEPGVGPGPERHEELSGAGVEMASAHRVGPGWRRAHRGEGRPSG